jgi:hypothetical protein
VIGFGAGYYLGAKAGRQRYEEMRRWIASAKDSDVASTVADKARAVADLGVERAKGLVDKVTHDHDDESPFGAGHTADTIDLTAAEGIAQ